jgi:hypothetical protein
MCHFDNHRQSSCFSICNPDPDYNQYICIENYVRDILFREKDCLIPYEMLTFDNGSNSRACKTRAEYAGKLKFYLVCVSTFFDRATDARCHGGLEPISISGSKRNTSFYSLSASWNKTDNLFEQVMTEPEVSGCKVECTTWQYTESSIRLNKDDMYSFTPYARAENIWFKILMPVVRVSQGHAQFINNASLRSTKSG